LLPSAAANTPGRVSEPSTPRDGDEDREADEGAANGDRDTGADSPSAMTRERIQAMIERLQRAEGEVRRLEDDLSEAATVARGPALEAIREAIVEGLGEGDGAEAAIALVPLAQVLAELEGPEVCDLLIDVLGSDEPEVRFAAGRGLQELAYDRFKEVAEAIERAVRRLPANHHGLRELPFVIGEVAEPGAPRILRGYLQHAEAEVVASAIEALASIGDPAAIPELRKLTRDPRTVQIDDEDGEGQVSIGALAQEAIAMIDPGGSPHPPPVRPDVVGDARARPNRGERNERGGGRRR
jgi:hypothetical protein